VKDDGGWMLTEGVGAILFYLIMFGTIAGVVYVLFSSSKLSQMQQSITSISMQIQGLYAGSSSYSGLDTSLAVKSGLIPKNLIRGAAAYTPWGGSITLSPGSDVSTYRISLAQISQSDCTKLATYQLDTWEAVQVNGTNISAAQRVTDAARSCGPNNTITYTGR
jgi:hypothetical protein